MTLTEGFVRENIYIDFGSEILYGDDQAYISYPAVFPTVGFQLMATNGLVEIADRIRKDKGFRPMHAMDEFTDDTCDNEGWYDFFIGLNRFTETHMDASLDFVVVNSDSEDNEETYTIDLTEEEQIAIYNRLDEQCRKYEGIELYTDRKDPRLEKKVEALLTRYELFFHKSEVWIEEEKMYEVLYSVTVDLEDADNDESEDEE